jgi:hypothetical protein
MIQEVERYGEVDGKLRTGSGAVDSACAVSLLDGEAASKRPGDGYVAAADGTNVTGRCWDGVLVTSISYDEAEWRHTANAVEVVRHLNVDGEVLFLCLR